MPTGYEGRMCVTQNVYAHEERHEDRSARFVVVPRGCGFSDGRVRMAFALAHHASHGGILATMGRLFNGIIVAFVLPYISTTSLGLAGQTTTTTTKGAKAAALKNPVPSTPQSIAAGAASFQKYCRFCHGADAKGDGPQAPKDTHPPNLTDDKWDHGSTDAEIFTTIKDGIGPKFDMKGFNSKLTPQEMWSIVNYIRSLGSKATAP
jgi:mono/diheme cytochrome c family protein